MRNVDFRAILSLVCSLGLAASVASAAGKPSKPPKNKPVRIKAALTINPALADLATAKGTLDFDSKKHTSLKGLVRLPAASASLGISDGTTAAAAQLHFEFAREGAVFADCTLAFQPDDKDPATTPAFWQYRLHVKTNGKRDVKGTCGTVPVLAAGDTLTAYSIVNGVRVDFMSH